MTFPGSCQSGEIMAMLGNETLWEAPDRSALAGFNNSHVCKAAGFQGYSRAEKSNKWCDCYKPLILKKKIS